MLLIKRANAGVQMDTSEGDTTSKQNECFTNLDDRGSLEGGAATLQIGWVLCRKFCSYSMWSYRKGSVPKLVDIL